MKRIIKRIFWKWKLIWGNHYRVYDKNQNKIHDILIYHKKIYILN